MSETLKPCPFCGGPVKLERTIDGRKWWGVVCRNTSNRGGTCAIEQRPSASEEAAVGRWNRRAEDARIASLESALASANLECEQSRKTIAELREANERMREALRPISMQDVRLAVGEGKLTAAEILAGVNAELRRRATLQGGNDGSE